KIRCYKKEPPRMVSHKPPTMDRQSSHHAPDCLYYRIPFRGCQRPDGENFGAPAGSSRRIEKTAGFRRYVDGNVIVLAIESGGLCGDIENNVPGSRHHHFLVRALLDAQPAPVVP